MNDKIQDLLDEEARIGNECYYIEDKYPPLRKNLFDKVTSLKEERRLLHIKIKEMRGTVPPGCWGEDDCSTSVLSRCPWRIDCGTTGGL